MYYCEILPDPANQSHYVIVDGVIYSRHTDVKIAEAVRLEFIRAWVERLAASCDPNNSGCAKG